MTAPACAWRVRRSLSTSTQSRFIVSSLKDWFINGNSNSTNPLLTAVKGTLRSSHDEEPWPSSLSLSGIQPRHVRPAWDALVSDCRMGWEKIKDDPVVDLHAVNDLEAPLHSLRQITAFLSCVSERSERREWQEALCVWGDFDAYSLRKDSDVAARLQSLTVDNESDNHQRYAVDRWLRSYENETGKSLGDSESIDEYQNLEGAIRDLDFIHYPTDKHAMGNMYNYIGCRQRQAELLGYDNHVHQVLSSDLQDEVELIRKLQTEVSASIVPLFSQASDAHELRSSLDSFSVPSPAGARAVSHGPHPLSLEEHVTLNGALGVLNRLFQDLFGLKFVEDKDQGISAWNEDVKLFHLLDITNDSHLGSFFLDAFARDGKLSRPMSCGLLPRGGNTSTPLATLSLQMDQPVWDTQLPNMRWEDVDALFHEMGHVLTLLCRRSTLDSVAQPPFHLSELMPKFLEQWLADELTIKGLVHYSQRSPKDDDAAEEFEESLAESLRDRSRDRALSNAQLAFYGELELELFGTFDIAGDESILDLQNRVVNTMIPHDAPAKTDITPLVDIFCENAKGQKVAWFRYLWCDALSASIFARCKAQHEESDSFEETRASFRQFLFHPEDFLDLKSLVSLFDLPTTNNMVGQMQQQLMKRNSF